MHKPKQELSLINLITAQFRILERQGLIVSFPGPDGQVRWRRTEKDLPGEASDIENDDQLS